MDFAFTPEQEMLRDAVRGYLDEKMPLRRVRELMETEEGFDRGVWSEMAGMGWQAMAIPEAYGGAGFSFFELGILMEEMGRSLTPGPFLSSVVLGGEAVLLAGSEEQKQAVLPGIASGERLATLALVEASGSWEPDRVETTARRDGDAIVIDGEKRHVLDGHVADTLVVVARGEEGPELYLVERTSPGVTAERIETMDMTRKQATVRLEGVRVGEDARLGAPGSAGPLLARLFDRAAVALAFEQVGGAQRCMEMSVEYAQQRYQFGRPIGSFQAIKHKCADMLVAVESARSAAYYAGWAASADEDELRIVAPLAKSTCSDAYFSVAAETIQVHGGIGFTWEHDAHLYFKRAKTDELLFGDPVRWRGILADRLEL